MEKSTAFSKQDSLALKGIAILMMMWFHSFGAHGRIEGWDILYAPLDAGAFVSFSSFFRLCVPIFAFISGYGLYLSARKNCVDGETSGRWVVDRLFKTLKGFWFVYVISFVILQVFDRGFISEKYFAGHSKAEGMVYLTLDFLGISNIFDTPSLNGSWWYMGASVIYIMLMPLIVKWVDRFGCITLIGLVIAFPRMLIEHKFLGVGSAYSFILSVLLGVLFAKYSLFDKFEKIKITGKKWMDNTIFFVLLAMASGAGLYLWMLMSKKIVWECHFGIIPLILILFYVRFWVKIPGLNKVLAFFGKYSMNIFLFHTFLRVRLMPEFIYGFRRPVLIVLALFTISLIFSIAVEFLKKLLRYDVCVDKLCKKVLKAMEN